MPISVTDACQALEKRGLLRRVRRDDTANVIEQVHQHLGHPLPVDLMAFYLEGVEGVAGFQTIRPRWSARPEQRDDWPFAELASAQAIPIFWDGAGSLYGLDLMAERPAVYFFDHEDEFQRPRWAAGSSLGVFLLLLAEHDQALKEGRAAGWELAIDPDLEHCPRAPAIWSAG